MKSAGSLVGKFQVEIVDVGLEQMLQDRRVMAFDVALALVHGMAAMKLTPRLYALEDAIDMRDGQMQFVLDLAENAGVGEHPFPAGIVGITKVSHQWIVELEDLLAGLDDGERFVMKNVAEVFDE